MRLSSDSEDDSHSRACDRVMEQAIKKEQENDKLKQELQDRDETIRDKDDQILRLEEEICELRSRLPS